LIIFKKFINFIFFKPERLFMFLPPLNYPSEVRYIYILRNFLIYFKIKKWKKSFLMIIKGIEKLFFDILKILYFPFSAIIFFTKYRFIQPNYVQIGTVANHLCMMTKYQLIKNKIPIIFIPKHSNYSFITKIFKKNPKIIFVDSLILNIICLPFFYTNFISCHIRDIDYLYDNKKKKIGKREWSRVYCKLDFKKNGFFEFNDEYEKKCNSLIKDKFGFIEMNKTFILHARESKYIKTSYLRNCNINNYLDGMNFLISENYNVIRLTNSYDDKLKFHKNYYELNVDFPENQFLQFFLINNAKGFISCNSGPASIGLLFEAPMLQVNCIDIPYAIGEKSLYLPKIVKKKDKLIKFENLWHANDLIKSEQFANKMGYEVIENSKEELTEAIKEFFYLVNSQNTKNYQSQKKFKEKIQLISHGHSIANLTNHFFNKYQDLFK